MRSYFWGGITFVTGFITFIIVYGGISEIYDALAGIDLLSEDEASPFFSKITQWFLSLFTAVWIAQMIYIRRFTIQHGEEKNVSFGIVVAGLFIFIIFNLLKEMALKPYSHSLPVQLLSFVLDAFAAFGIWWALTQYWKSLLARRKSNRIQSTDY